MDKWTNDANRQMMQKEKWTDDANGRMMQIDKCANGAKRQRNE